MQGFSVWIDADSCPVPVRNLVLKFAKRLQFPLYFVANRQLSLPDWENVHMIQAEATADAADNYIVANVEPDDIAVTRDIPLAARLIAKKITVLNDRGTIFTPENISEYISIRNFNYSLVTAGIQPERNGSYNQKNSNNFANCFDKEIQKKLKRYR
ncbi:YaiI/YqxD family protein [Treponema brennaborense]|uniref:UPF0178 protein Trebr_0935 n=1 Tax=Treponema brennaborense (strain DSM 12168 / CIP 105900 / DD5/3) TaxID=906968 RepID=F4LJH6_TREBD|nr:DUF188 domain-containing protein [Treponema brennaborense]AEE16371.1 UPF0178 protein yaiI [Treponema brennaborense DSM 12168]